MLGFNNKRANSDVHPETWTNPGRGAFFMSKKYSSALKKQVVLEYLEGNLGFQSLAKKHGIARHKQIQEWYRNYQTEGAKGLDRTMTYKKHTPEFKLRVLTHRKQHELSYSETATLFGIRNSSTIAVWQRQYNKYGILGLEKAPRGHAMKERRTKSSEPLTVQEREELERLRRENEHLQVALAYEKKLQASVQREDRRIPRKRR